MCEDLFGEYGDMPPWGSGPDPRRIYEPDGYVTTATTTTSNYYGPRSRGRHMVLWGSWRW